MLAGGIALRACVGVAADPPIVTNPRATSGDPIEPDWHERLSISVGPTKADLVGSDEKVLQAAVDTIARWGGGTVRILPGTYRLRNAVYLASNVRIMGSGSESVLVKEPSVATTLSGDSDWYDQEITLSDAKGFRVGDGVCLQTKNPHHGGTDVLKRTLVARSGNRFKLDRALRENFWVEGKPTVATLFPILTGEHITNVTIEDLVLDGNRIHNENLNGNYAGCIFFQDCRSIAIRGVEARNYNGDGMSWQICHDVVVENCHSHDNAGLGLHPGSGSQRPVMRGNRIVGNDIGIFFCWGVKFGLAEKNRVEDNRRHGISLGHCDTDNRVVDNDVLRSGEVGILFRDEARGKDFWANRNEIENNRVIDSGADTGVAIDVQGRTKEIALLKNALRETRQPMRRIGVRIGAQAGPVRLVDNAISGFAVPVADLRKA
jgi:hypothetical protein